MADDAVLFSGEVEYLEGAAAPRGDGFYFAVVHNDERISDWTGPFVTRSAAEIEFLKRAGEIVSELAKKMMGL